MPRNDCCCSCDPQILFLEIHAIPFPGESAHRHVWLCLCVPKCCRLGLGVTFTVYGLMAPRVWRFQSRQ